MAIGNQPESMIDPNGTAFEMFTKNPGMGEPNGWDNLSGAFANANARLMDGESYSQSLLAFGGGATGGEGGSWPGDMTTAMVLNGAQAQQFWTAIRSGYTNAGATINDPGQDGGKGGNKRPKGSPVGPFDDSDNSATISNGFLVDFISIYEIELSKLASNLEGIGNNKIVVFAHADGYNIIDSRTGSDVKIKGSYGLDYVLKEEFPRYEQILKERIPTTIFLVGCNTAEVAQSLSSKHSFLTVVGANGYVWPELVNNKRDVRLGGVSSSSNYNLNDGLWNFYRNGKFLFSKPGDYFNNLDAFR